MKSFPKKITVMIASLLLSSSAVADIQNHAAAGVNKVVFDLPGDLLIQAGDKENLVVEAEAKVLSQLNISVKGNVLDMRSKGSFKTDKPLKFTLTVKSLQSLKSTGSGNSTISGFHAGDMEAVVAGSGNIDLKDVKLNKALLSITSAANIVATGSANAVNASISGTGDINAVALNTKTADAKIEGSGNIKVNASDSLKASIGGAGNIEYKGKPKVVKQISGAGSIDPI